MKYWLCEPYLGIGPAAHSFLENRRFRFARDLRGFIAGPLSAVAEDGPGGGFEEYAMLRLRLKAGLDLSDAARIYGIDSVEIKSRAGKFASAGLLNICGERICLTPEGFLLSNTITAELLFE
jgi:oxygen-independent coproporphyrinogen-3 oxidase